MLRQVRTGVKHLRLFCDTPGIDPVLIRQECRRLLCTFVLDKCSCQRGSRVFLVLLFSLRSGKEHTAFYQHKLCRHDDELSGYLHVHLPHLLNIFHVLIKYQRDRNIVYIDLVLCDKRKKQVKRSLKDLQPEIKVTHRNGTSLITKSNADSTPSDTAEITGVRIPVASRTSITIMMTRSYLMTEKYHLSGSRK